VAYLVRLVRVRVLYSLFFSYVSLSLSLPRVLLKPVGACWKWQAHTQSGVKCTPKHWLIELWAKSFVKFLSRHWPAPLRSRNVVLKLSYFSLSNGPSCRLIGCSVNIILRWVFSFDIIEGDCYDRYEIELLNCIQKLSEFTLIYNKN